MSAPGTSSVDPPAEKEKQSNLKKPLDTPFRQQRMQAWQPILTPKWAILTFFVVGVIFVPLGVGFYISSASVVWVEAVYDGTGGSCPMYSMCNVTITPTRDMVPPVYFYYQLDKFFQNHRRYVSSRSDAQLSGTNVTLAELLSSGVCSPLDNAGNGVPLNPCGLIAGSMFNDTFKMYEGDRAVPMSSNGIIWPSDLAKYAAPNGGYVLAEHGFPYLNATNPDFIVWMRTAGLPRFKKLYRIINETLRANVPYRVEVLNVFPVRQFAGTKSIYVTNTSWLGGSNNFLGIAYMAVGSLCIVLGAIFLLKHCISPRKLGDPQYLAFDH